MLRQVRDAPRLEGRWPWLGHLPKLGRDALGTLRAARERHGPVVWIDMGFGSDVLLILDEDGLEVFRSKHTDSSHFSEFSRFLGQSMLTVDGAEHRRMRGISGAAFTPAGLSRARVGSIIAETVARRVETWRGRDEISIVEDTKTIALEVIFRVMGIDVSALPEWSRWFSEFMLGAINLPIMLPGTPAWRGQRGRRWLEAELRKVVADARARGDHDSIVGVMAHGHDESGATLDDQELIDNLLVLGFAGHETTASTMAWSMLQLGRSPERWAKLREEAEALGELPTDFSELLRRAPFAVGVFRESLRLYPPVALDSRYAHSACELGGYEIPVGTTVGASLLLISRDPDRYDEPNSWRPERWLDLDRKPTPAENCQFGGGAHFCLGYHMALLEGTLFLVHAARSLGAWGRRPQLDGPMPKPSYVPLVQPPRKAKLSLIAS